MFPHKSKLAKQAQFFLSPPKYEGVVSLLLYPCSGHQTWPLSVTL